MSDDSLHMTTTGERELHWQARALAAEAGLADADKLLETVRVAMRTSSVMEGLNVIDNLEDEVKRLKLELAAMRSDHGRV